ncbi:arginyl-tRNA--protein transferase 2-like isoform X1 [Canna indica]|uniref:Arginyl-tRNA--protein transferase n=1 Tax=Canna indica TaxID=4628 RepID=A0AAQ3KTN3_9LILI|nr:arginyl-tRNA--protein transferase 2-like isoform X1 [Canna indica]
MGDGASSSRSGRGGGERERAKERWKIGESVVMDHGRRRTSCGYCKSTRFYSVSHGLWANSITAEDYQDLLDRGWRRSGSYLYKPEMNRTCCPSYTIRLKASDFYPSKDQARIYKKMQRFLDDMTSVKKSDNSKQKANSSTRENSCNDNDNDVLHSLSTIIDNAVSDLFGSKCLSNAQFPKAVVKKVTFQAKKKLMGISEDLVYTSNIAFQIAATIRRNQATDDIIKCMESNLQDIHPTTIAEKLSCLVKQHGIPSELLAKACNGHLNFYTTIKHANPASIGSKENTLESRGNGGNAKRVCTTNSCTVLPQKRRKLEIRMKRSSFDQEEFDLYKRYQIKVHDDKPEKVTVSSYQRFLVDTPIIFVPPISGDNTIPPCGFGSFHQQYLIDGKLVAVGVVDILPKCLSSKYLFWDPDFAFLSLGKYSALQEINWVKETQYHCPTLQYYYLGYYIHSCNKMRYKAKYRPSELLCPLRYQWVPFEIARPLLDKNAYVVLSDYLAGRSGADPLDCVPTEDLSDEDEEVDFCCEDTGMGVEDESDMLDSSATLVDASQGCDVGDIVFDVKDSRVKFKDLEKVFGPLDRKVIARLESQLQRYVEVVGKELAGRMKYVLG